MKIAISKYTLLRNYRIAIVVTAVAYFAALLYIVFFARRRRNISVREINIVPVRNMVNSYHHLPDVGRYNFYSNLFGNIILFIPLSFILGFFFRMKSRYLLLIGFLLSSGIEFLQFVLKIGVADIDDLVLNTLGTLIGTCFVKVLSGKIKFSNSGE